MRISPYSYDEVKDVKQPCNSAPIVDSMRSTSA